MFFSARSRTVRCLHCHRHFPVPGSATILTCPMCYKRVRVDDVVVTRPTFTARLETCGRIVVKARGKVVASVVQAGLGIQVHGELETQQAATDEVVLAERGVWKGDLTCASIKVMAGARIVGGKFCIDRSRAGNTTVEAKTI